MRLSCSTQCLPDEPLDQAFSAIREAGYEAVELSWWQVESEAYADRCPANVLQDILGKYGFTLSGLTIREIAATSPEELREELSSLHDMMQTAKALGLEAVNLLGGDRRHQSLEMFAVALEALLAIADEMQLNIQLSNSYASRVEQIEDLRYVMQAVDHPRLFLLNNTGQFHSAAVNPRYLLTEFANRLALAHITDQVGKRAVPIGRGEMNVAAIVEHLAKIGYDGWLVVDQEFADYTEAVNILTANRLALESILNALQ
ncbi:MAG: sugar phosphate isomerase/epimerase [Phycisphaerales bacterium]|nr:sugar phosphate isomerase/epimerase [Phycisphaerales bacterium]